VEKYPLDCGGVLGSERCAHHAWMQRIGRDRRAFEPPGQLVAEENVGEFGLAVRPCPRVGPLALEVAEVDTPAGLRVGGDRPYAR
jgi:hypothetical protein